MAGQVKHTPLLEDVSIEPPLQPTKSHLVSKHRWETFLVVSLTAIILSVVSVTFAVCNAMRHFDLQEKMERRSGFCVICSELYPEGYFDETAERMIASLNKYTDDGVTICCARNISQKGDLMKLQLKRRDSLTYPHIFNKTDFDVNNLNFGSISAHKALRTQPGREPKFGDKFYTLNVMQSNDPRNEHVNGVTVKADGLQIIYPGLYFVYKSVFFVPNTNHPCKNFKEKTFTSALLRNSTRRSYDIDLLLRSEHTCCPDCVQHRETAFTGGVFYLDEGDLLQVEISAYGVVYFKKDVTYFGLVMMNANIQPQ